MDSNYIKAWLYVVIPVAAMLTIVAFGLGWAAVGMTQRFIGVVDPYVWRWIGYAVAVTVLGVVAGIAWGTRSLV